MRWSMDWNYKATSEIMSGAEAVTNHRYMCVYIFVCIRWYSHVYLSLFGFTFLFCLTFDLVFFFPHSNVDLSVWTVQAPRGRVTGRAGAHSKKVAEQTGLFPNLPKWKCETNVKHSNWFKLKHFGVLTNWNIQSYWNIGFHWGLVLGWKDW